MSEILKDPNIIKAMAEGIFGPERVDLTDVRNVTTSRPTFTLTIHFPEFTLKNSRNQRQLIQDLYVRFNTTIYTDRSSGYKVETWCTGLRRTMSLKEAQSGFGHSHLQRGTALRDFSGFCLGSSSFAMIMENLKVNGGEDEWELMLLSLTNYVEWESLEGGPYIRLSEIDYTSRGAAQQAVTEQQLEQEVYRLVRHIPAQCWEFTPNLRLITTHPDLLDFFNTYSRIRKLVPLARQSGITPDLLQTWQNSISENAARFSFKGKAVPIKVWDPALETAAQLQTNSNHIEPAVTQRFITILTNQISRYQKIIQYEHNKNIYAPRLRQISAY